MLVRDRQAGIISLIPPPDNYLLLSNIFFCSIVNMACRDIVMIFSDLSDQHLRF